MEICVPKRPVPITATFLIFWVIDVSFLIDLQERDGRPEARHPFWNLSLFTSDHLPPVHLGFPVSLRGTATLSNGIMIGLSAKGKGKILDLACISPTGPGIII